MLKIGKDIFSDSSQEIKTNVVQKYKPQYCGDLLRRNATNSLGEAHQINSAKRERWVFSNVFVIFFLYKDIKNAVKYQKCLSLKLILFYSFLLPKTSLQKSKFCLYFHEQLKEPKE